MLTFYIGLSLAITIITIMPVIEKKEMEKIVPIIFSK
jgi:hypothetical protein